MKFHKLRMLGRELEDHTAVVYGEFSAVQQFDFDDDIIKYTIESFNQAKPIKGKRLKYLMTVEHGMQDFSTDDILNSVTNAESTEDLKCATFKEIKKWIHDDEQYFLIMNYVVSAYIIVPYKQKAALLKSIT